MHAAAPAAPLFAHACSQGAQQAMAKPPAQPAPNVPPVRGRLVVPSPLQPAQGVELVIRALKAPHLPVPAVSGCGRHNCRHFAIDCVGVPRRAAGPKKCRLTDECCSAIIAAHRRILSGWVPGSLELKHTSLGAAAAVAAA